MLRELQSHFGREIPGAKYGYSCQQNALHNTCLAIFAEMEAEILYINNSTFCHAYITDGRTAYSEGLTWRDDRYPELTRAEIFNLNGVDITRSLLRTATQTDEGVWFYSTVLHSLENQLSGITVAINEFIGN